MHHYIMNFIVYTLAMLGVIFIAFVTAKKALSIDPKKDKDKFLTIESSLNLEPRKNLYIVKAGCERFLLSTDPEGSHYMTKLAEENIPPKNTYSEKHSDNILSIACQNNTPSGISIMRKILDRLHSGDIPDNLKRY